MTARQVSSIEQLLNASSDDEGELAFVRSDRAFGFFAQQAVEKLYKALLKKRTDDYPFVHDLQQLRLRLEASGLTLPACEWRLENLSEYAGVGRYDDPMPLVETERSTIRQCVAALRAFVEAEVAKETAAS